MGNDPYRVSSIQIVYLFNGPEYGDKAEIAQVTADGASYTLSVRNDANDADADWSGPGTVTKCGATTSDPATGSGCFLITNPFPAPVRVAGVHGRPGHFGRIPERQYE